MTARASGSSLVAPRPLPLGGVIVRELALLVAASLFLALAARIEVQLPFTPVPVTGQTLGVLLTGALYGPKRGALAVLAYVAEGAAGAPVFAAGRSGLPVLLGPTGGYLMGFVPAAAVAGWLSRQQRSLGLRCLTMMVASVIVYGVGVPWLSAVTALPLQAAVAKGVQPFLLGDLAKSALAAGVMPAGAALLARLGVRPH